VQANKSPIALLAVTPLEGTSPVLVTASAGGSYDPDGTIASATIDFGDGYVATGTSAAHTYQSAGTYTVKSTVVDNAGATATATQVVTVAVPQRYVVINSPGNGSTISTKPRVSAVGFSTKGVQAMQVLVDGRVAYKTLGNVVDATVNVGKGAHVLTVKCFDVSGETFSASVNVTAN
jgi:PKD repeat protein